MAAETARATCAKRGASGLPGVPVAQGRHTTRYRGAFAGQHTSQPLVAVEDLAGVFAAGLP